MRVIIADGAALLREGLRQLLVEAGFHVAGTASDLETLLDLVATTEPDVAIVDIRMPPSRTDEGLRAARHIRANHPGTGVLVLSQYVRVTYALELLAVGAHGVGYLLKDRVADIADWPPRYARSAPAGPHWTRTSSPPSSNDPDPAGTGWLN